LICMHVSHERWFYTYRWHVACWRQASHGSAWVHPHVQPQPATEICLTCWLQVRTVRVCALSHAHLKGFVVLPLSQAVSLVAWQPPSEGSMPCLLGRWYMAHSAPLAAKGRQWPVAGREPHHAQAASRGAPAMPRHAAPPCSLAGSLIA
jgi:hypothetical protein